MQQGNALQTAPFVNGEHLPRYMSTPVRIIGCLVDENASEVTIRTSDNKSVTVIRQTGGQPYGRAEVVEVLGHVTSPTCITEISHVDIIQPQGKEFRNGDPGLSLADVALFRGSPEARALFEYFTS